MGRPALALLALLAIFSGADAKKTKKLSAAEREERRAKGELLMNAVNLGDREEVERLIEEWLTQIGFPAWIAGSYVCFPS